jgi:serine/threonine protein kinase
MDKHSDEAFPLRRMLGGSSLDAASGLDIDITVDDPDDPLAPGAMVGGRYRVSQRIGSGGMGAVYVAHDEALDRVVAIKIARSEPAQREELERRLLLEARILARLNGPHVPRIFDIGWTTGNTDVSRPYLVLEYLDGCDVCELLQRHGPFTVEQAVKVALDVCEGLEEAHALGVVHRDVKPENLFITRRGDGQSQVKILDFGVSKQLFGPASTTKPGSPVGSPHYMSPEQLRASDEVDARSDVWSIGAVMFQVLAGGPPFNGSSMVEVCARVLSDPLPDLKTLRPDVPSALCAVIERCMDKEPERRYQTATDLALALRTAVLSRVTIPSARARKQTEVEFKRRDIPGLRSYSTAIAAAAVVLLTAGGLACATRAGWFTELGLKWPKTPALLGGTPKVERVEPRRFDAPPPAGSHFRAP